MSQEINPYEAPQSISPLSDFAQQNVPVVPVGAGLRIANFFIDRIVAQVLLGGLIGFCLGLVQEVQQESILGDIILYGGAFMMYVGYFILCEGFTGRTLGKLITGTKVVDGFGQKPSWGKVIGRSFARLIPFEPFSFLGSQTRGWHDSMTGTYVVKCR